MSKLLVSLSKEVSDSEIEKAVAAASDIILAYSKQDSKIEDVTLEVMVGPTWSRLVRVITHRSTQEVTSRSAFGFVDREGNLWKAAGWKAPAKNKPRGTLQDLYDKKKVGGWYYSIR